MDATFSLELTVTSPARVAYRDITAAKANDGGLFRVRFPTLETGKGHKLGPVLYLSPTALCTC